MDGLIVLPKWGELILSGEKTWEIRGSNTSHRGRHYLIESGGIGMVCGEFDLVDSCSLTASDYYDNLTKHHLPTDYFYHSDLLKKYSKPHCWIIENVVKYDKPLPYIHPRGAVIWVKDVKIIK